MSGLAQGRQRKLRERMVALLRVIMSLCVAGLARTLGLGNGSLAGAPPFVQWPGRGLLRGQLQRLVQLGQRAIRGALGSQGGGGGGGGVWALLWHLLVSSGAVHQPALALALPLNFRTHLAVTLVSSVIMNLLCNDAACAALASSAQLRQHVGAAASRLSIIHGIIAAPGPFGGGILLPAMSAGAAMPGAAGSAATAAVLLTAAGLHPRNSSAGVCGAGPGVASAATTAGTGPPGAGASGGCPAGLDLTAWDDWGLPAPLLRSEHALTAHTAASGAAMSAGLGGEATTDFSWPGCWAVVSFVQVLVAVGVTSMVVYVAEWARRQAFVDQIRDLQQSARLREALLPPTSEAGPSGVNAATAPVTRHVEGAGGAASGDELGDLLPRLVLPPPPDHDVLQYAAKAVLLGLLGLAWWDALLIMKAATLQLA
ncbi:hypothetical protein HXX76_004373 [Chlamydomonas incerta]|uniref:Uncharacterized protein n=1 Tax=Chlamydomonas incerta TaxID=51695 RepID=A0A835W8T3_CHLIN|nr:hypothetical protein HXX76_004373 [Chlamydomonas incerta]|eukprot:KAG2440261.1 hypothetical protein HXX76_004373 [Chlamydomonas incerta]